MTLTNRQRDALECIVSFWRDPDGVTASDLADELGITKGYAVNVRADLQRLGLVFGDGYVATGTNRSLIRTQALGEDRGGWASDRARVLASIERSNDRHGVAPTRCAVARASGIHLWRVEKCIAELRALRALLSRGQWAPTPAGVLLVASLNGREVA